MYQKTTFIKEAPKSYKKWCFRWPHHIFVLVTVENKELGIVTVK